MVTNKAAFISCHRTLVFGNIQIIFHSFSLTYAALHVKIERSLYLSRRLTSTNKVRLLTWPPGKAAVCFTANGVPLTLLE